jgi:ATPase subunit of ABC transporter with duplicated ATPase domains
LEKRAKRKENRLLINHLDIPSRTRFEQALENFRGGAILTVVHDRYFIESFASNVWTVKDGKITK